MHMEDIAASQLKTILHSKRANLYYLEHCRVLVNGGRVEYVTDAGKQRLYWNIPIANTTSILLGTGTSITQAAMRELAKADLPVHRRELPRDAAVAHFKSLGEHYKAEIIASIPAGEEVSLYREGNFEDLCRGPHVPSTGKLKHFKLMKVAGAYWRGDHRNEMLQRIYGTAWASKAELKQYLNMLAEAEKRDHRKLGKQLDLFHMQEEAPGMAFWHPRGWAIYQQVQDYMRQVYRETGYDEVHCPAILDVSLWKKSGHWDNYQENMFFTESEKRTYAVRPMN